jgi:hypothetical protein
MSQLHRPVDSAPTTFCPDLQPDHAHSFLEALCHDVTRKKISAEISPASGRSASSAAPDSLKGKGLPGLYSGKALNFENRAFVEGGSARSSYGPGQEAPHP